MSLRIGKECATHVKLDSTMVILAKEGVTPAQQGRSRLLAVQSALHVWATHLLHMLAAMCAEDAQQD